MGRSYEAVIRVNSQSGKGGVAYIMKFEHGLDLPRRLQIEFSAVIQRRAEQTGSEVTADQIWSAFESTYLTPARPVALVGPPVTTTVGTAGEPGRIALEAPLRVNGGERTVRGQGADVIAAFADALRRDGGLAVEVLDYHQHAVGEGVGAAIVVYAEARVGGGTVRWGVGLDPDLVTASLRAVASAVNRTRGPAGTGDRYSVELARLE